MNTAEQLSRLLLALPLAITVCHVGGMVANRLKQPPVVGEIAAGILIGPSLLGQLWPQAQTYLFPPEVVDHINILGQIGLFTFMYLTGLTLDFQHLRGQSRVAAVVSQTGMLVPLLLGSALGLALYGELAPSGSSRIAFTLFIAVAMSITAFPVLARILTDRGIYRSPMGGLAMACAAVDDITAWCLLALVVAISHSGTPLDALTAAVSVVLYAVVMLRLVRPLLEKALRSRTADRDRPMPAVLLILFCGIFLSALVTDEIGVHALFGAFMFGIVTPRGSRVIEQAAGALRSVMTPLLLPLFFLTAGLKADIGLLAADTSLWLWLGAILAVAVAGKWGGAAVAARLSGLRWPEALTLGALMNCRGVTELVVLSVGLDLGVIGKEVFTMLALMALVTTAMTSPAVAALSTRIREREAATATGRPRIAPQEIKTPSKPREMAGSL
jgi:Kef-type K+ transport system membrane component KefB